MQSRRAICYQDNEPYSLILMQIHKNGHNGFQLEAAINSFCQRWSSGKDILLDFEAFGVGWRLSIAKTGVALIVDGTSHVSGGVLSCSFGKDAQWTLSPIELEDSKLSSWWEWDWPRSDQARAGPESPASGIEWRLAPQGESVVSKDNAGLVLMLQHVMPL